MRRWKYIEPGPNNQIVENIWTEDQIRRLFYPMWVKEMHRLRKKEQISFQTCLEDWITVHWAEEI